MFVDVGGLQVCTDFEADFKGTTRNDTTVRPEVAQDANEVLRPPVEEIEHEDNQCDLR